MRTEVRSVDRAQARRFLVQRHLLAPPRSLPAEPASVLTVARRFGSLQFDPVDLVGARNHDLVLLARVPGYQRAWCDDFLYGEPSARKLVEVYNKSLNLVPVEELAHHRLTWDRAAERLDAGLLREHAAVTRAVLERLGREGHRASVALSQEHDTKVRSYWGMPTSVGRAVLDALFETGRVGIARREGNRKHYDLLERCLPADTLAKAVSAEESRRHRLHSRHRAVGLLGATGAAELWTGLGTAAQRHKALAALLRDGSLVPVRVEGVKGLRYVLPDELALLDAATEPLAKAPGVALLAPLDPLLWDRKLVEDLWDFKYLWEIYTPVEKRLYGAYVLPVLYGDALVGRLEPRFDRATATLSIEGQWWTDPVTRTAPFADALASALSALARFAGAANLRLPRASPTLWKRVREALPGLSRGTPPKVSPLTEATLTRT